MQRTPRVLQGIHRVLQGIHRVLQRIHRVLQRIHRVLQRIPRVQQRRSRTPQGASTGLLAGLAVGKLPLSRFMRPSGGITRVGCRCWASRKAR